jgi:pimeloyl-ACP methyl ester carboxylesterase
VVLRVVQHSLSDDLCLNWVIAGAAPPLNAVDADELHAEVWCLLLGTGERHQPSLVELVVAERDQRFMLASIVPAQREGVHPGGALALCQDRLELIELLLLIDVIVGERDTRDILVAADSISVSVRGAQRVTVPNAGHLVNVWAPEVFSREVLRFLEGAGR